MCSQGLSVFQQDIDTGLSEYEDKSFDYVILSQSSAAGEETRFRLEGSRESGQESYC